MRRSAVLLFVFSQLLLLSACGNERSALLSNADSDTPSASGAEPHYVRIDADLYAKHLQVDRRFVRDHRYDSQFVFGYVNREAFAGLPQEVASHVEILDETTLRRVHFDTKTLTHNGVNKDGDQYDGYHNYEALTAELEDLALNFPGQAKLFSAGQSVEERELWVIRLSSAIDQTIVDGGKPKLLYVANMHGDEVVGRELTLYLARDLLTGYGNDARITNLLDNAEIFIMPSMNPDGFERGRRSNARRVDLNRDFPDFTSDPTDTPAGRQPETQALMGLHDEHHFVLALNFHGGEVCFNMPWDTQGNGRDDSKFGDDALMQVLARQYADQNPTMRANDQGPFERGVTYGYEWYEVDGGLQDWSNYYRRSIHATIELSYAKWPAGSDLDGFWQENRESMLAYLESGLTGFHLAVRNSAGDAVSEVQITSGTRTVRYEDFRINRPALATDNPILVTIAAEGSKPLEVDLSATAFAGDYLEIQLEPEQR